MNAQQITTSNPNPIATPPPPSSWIEHLSYHPIDSDHGVLVVLMTKSPQAYLYSVPSWLPGLVLAGVYSDRLERRSIGRAYTKRVKGRYPSQVVPREEIEGLGFVE